MQSLPAIAQSPGKPIVKKSRVGDKADDPEETIYEADDGQTQLQLQVLQGLGPGAQTVNTIVATKAPRHPAADNAAQWMQLERVRAQSRSEKRWKKKFEAWQRQAVISNTDGGGSGKGLGMRPSAMVALQPHDQGEGRGLSQVASLPAIKKIARPRAVAPTEADLFVNEVLLDEAKKRADERQRVKDAKEAERQRLRELELQRLRDSVLEPTKQVFEKKQQEVGQFRADLQQLADQLRSEREERASLERRITQVTVERDSLRENTSRREEKLRQTLQEKRDTSSRLTELGSLLRDLESRDIEAVSTTLSSSPQRPPEVAARLEAEQLASNATHIQAKFRQKHARQEVAKKRKDMIAAKVQAEMETLQQKAAADAHVEMQRQEAAAARQRQEEDEQRRNAEDQLRRKEAEAAQQRQEEDEQRRKEIQRQEDAERSKAQEENRRREEDRTRKALDVLAEAEEAENPEDDDLKRDAQAAIESALLGPEDDVLKRDAQAAIESALLGPEDDDLKRDAQAAIESALLGPEDDVLKKDAQAAIESALLGPEDDDLKRDAQAAIE